MSPDSKQENPDEFSQIVEAFNKQTEAEKIAKAAAYTDNARSALLKAATILHGTAMPGLVQQDVLLTMNSCIGLERAFAAYVGEQR